MKIFRVAITVPLILFATSCVKQPLRVQAPGIDPEAAAADALVRYDGDGDGILAEDELAISALSVELWDEDNSGGVTGAEISKRLEEFVATGVGLVNVSSFVSWNGRPLADAKIEFEPDSFLGEKVQGSTGTTDSSGSAVMCVAEELLPHPNVTGIQPGLYKVRITHPEIDLPENYNAKTTLTYECSPVDELPTPVFALTK